MQKVSADDKRKAKTDKRAAALRDNLRKRKAKQKTGKAGKKEE